MKLSTSNVLKDWQTEAERQGHEVKVLAEAGEDYMKQVEVTRSDGHQRLLLLRLNSVVIVPIIHSRGKVFTLLCTEYREGALRELTGFPAESLDKSKEDILEAARRGISEELSIDPAWVGKASYIDIGPVNYTSPGTTNEQKAMVKVEINLPENQAIESLDGRAGGLEEEGEHIVSSLRELSIELLSEIETEADKLALLKVLWDMQKAEG